MYGINRPILYTLSTFDIPVADPGGGGGRGGFRTNAQGGGGGCANLNPKISRYRLL